MTKLREARFAIPIDVAEKRVGNILGCEIQTAVNAPTTPNLAQPTRTGKVHPGRAVSMKQRILIPAADCRAKKTVKIILGLKR